MHGGQGRNNFWRHNIRTLCTGHPLSVDVLYGDIQSWSWRMHFVYLNFSGSSAFRLQERTHHPPPQRSTRVCVLLSTIESRDTCGHILSKHAPASVRADPSLHILHTLTSADIHDEDICAARRALSCPPAGQACPDSCTRRSNARRCRGSRRCTHPRTSRSRTRAGCSRSSLGSCPPA